MSMVDASAVNDLVRPAARAEPLLGAGSAIAAWLALFVGFLLIGVVAQGRDLVAGLWITEAIAIALPALILLRAANVKLGPYLGLGFPGWKWIAIAVAAGLLNQPVVSLLEQVAHSLLPQAWINDFDAKNRLLDAVFASRQVAMVVTVTVAAPLGEEFFFRGFALQALAKSMTPLRAALLSGLMFGLLHLDPVGLLGLMEIGVLLAVLRHASGSLWPAVVGHAVNNGIAAAAFVLKLQDPSEAPPWWFLAVGAILLFAGGAVGLRLLRAPGPVPGDEQRWSVADPAPDRFRFARAWPLVAIWLLAVAAGATQFRTVLQALRG